MPALSPIPQVDPPPSQNTRAFFKKHGLGRGLVLSVFSVPDKTHWFCRSKGKRQHFGPRAKNARVENPLVKDGIH